MASRLLRSLRNSSMTIQPYVAGTTRANASDVDISQPWVMAIYPPRDNDDNNNSPIDETNEFLSIENGNHAVECLQMFIDALVESGRAGDDRLGVHFFREWVQAVTGGMEAKPEQQQQQKQRPKKKQKGNSNRSRQLITCHLDHYHFTTLHPHLFIHFVPWNMPMSGHASER